MGVIINKHLRLREEDVLKLTSTLRESLEKVGTEIKNRIKILTEDLLGSTPRFSYIKDINSTKFSGYYCCSYSVAPSLWITPYTFGLRETWKFQRIYSPYKKEFIWNEGYEVRPEILRELSDPDKTILENSLAIFKVEIGNLKIPIETCWTGQKIDQFPKYLEEMRDLFRTGDIEILENLQKKVIEYWRLQILTPVCTTQSRLIIQRATEDELREENPELLDLIRNFKNTENYSEYTGKREKEGKKRIKKDDLTSSISDMKNRIELIK